MKNKLYVCYVLFQSKLTQYLLIFSTPPSRNDKAVPYQRVDWFYQDDIKKERDHSTKEKFVFLFVLNLSVNYLPTI